MLAIRTLRAERDPTLAFKEYFQRPPIQHAEALSKVEIGEFVRRLKAYNGSRTVVIAIWYYSTPHPALSKYTVPNGLTSNLMKACGQSLLTK